MKNQPLDMDRTLAQATTPAMNSVLPPAGQAPSQALQALAILETTASQAHAHLLQCLLRQDGQLVVRIPTHVIGPSAYANRSAAAGAGEAFRVLKNAIKVNGGNAQPILLRPVSGAVQGVWPSPTGDDVLLYEIVAGHRRYQACCELGLPVMTMVVPVMSETELVLARHHENHARADLTPLENGCMFKRWLDAKLFKSLHDMSRCLGREVSSLLRAVALATLPKALVRSFASPQELQYKGADILNSLLKMNWAAVLLVRPTWPEKPRCAWARR